MTEKAAEPQGPYEVQGLSGELVSRQRDRRRVPLTLWGGSLLLSLAPIAAFVSLFWTPKDPTAQDIEHRLSPPGQNGYLLGSDGFGRDIASQLMAGAQNSLVVAGLGVSLALCGGIAAASVAVIRSGWMEEIILRLSDVVYAFPVVIVALILSAKMGPGNLPGILAVAILFTPVVARLVRGSAVPLFEREFVLAARAYGRGRTYIFFRHILPNLSALVIVQATVMFAIAILLEASLSYLGLGVSPPTPSWGRMLRDAQQFLGVAPWVAIWPGVAIIVTVLGFNLTGDGLRDLADPKLHRAVR